MQVSFDWEVDYEGEEVPVTVSAEIEADDPDVGFIGGAVLESVLTKGGREILGELSQFEQEVLEEMARVQADEEARDYKAEKAEREWEARHDR